MATLAEIVWGYTGSAYQKAYAAVSGANNTGNLQIWPYGPPIGKLSEREVRQVARKLAFDKDLVATLLRSDWELKTGLKIADKKKSG